MESNLSIEEVKQVLLNSDINLWDKIELASASNSQATEVIKKIAIAHMLKQEKVIQIAEAVKTF